MKKIILFACTALLLTAINSWGAAVSCVPVKIISIYTNPALPAEAGLILQTQNTACGAWAANTNKVIQLNAATSDKEMALALTAMSLGKTGSIWYDDSTNTLIQLSLDDI